MLPSTVGVSVLAAIALATRPTLAALLGGVWRLGCGLLSLPRIEAGLYADPKTRVIYRG